MTKVAEVGAATKGEVSRIWERLDLNKDTHPKIDILVEAVI